MNRTDERATVEAIKSILTATSEFPPRGSRHAVVAFDIGMLSNQVRNLRNSRLIDEVNDVLSSTEVCRELEGIFTVCEYERGTLFLIQADLAVSVTPVFNPELKVMTNPAAA